MGYCSEVAYVIEPTHITGPEFMAEFAKDKPGAYNLVTDGYYKSLITVTESRVQFHEKNVKWYATRLTFSTDTLFAEIDAHEALIDWAEENVDDAYRANQGGFARVGENTGDIETRYWGEDPYDLVTVQTFIDTVN